MSHTLPSDYRGVPVSVRLVSLFQNGETTLTGEEVLERFKASGMQSGGGKMRDSFLAHPDRIPMDWRNVGCILFPSDDTPVEYMYFSTHSNGWFRGWYGHAGSLTPTDMIAVVMAEDD